MGQLCSKQTQTTSNLIETEKEVSLPSYSSDADKVYELQEKKYNYFRKINYADFLYSLVNFSNENATLEDDYSKTNIEYSMNEPFFCDIFSNDIFQSFLENKLLKHKAIYEEAGNNEKITSIFKEGFLSVNSGLGLKLSQDAKEKGDENADKNTIVKKGDALAYGLLYCAGANFVKIKSIFNIFQENGQLKTSEKFSEFLLSLFIIPSYGMASARNKLGKFEEIGAIEVEKLKALLGNSELKDCQNLVTVTNQMIFGQDLSGALTYQNLKDKFAFDDKDHSLAFLLSPSGVRYMLSKHNV
jgi:hypothetical protein